ncbi:MAG: S-methyl-5-thioribose-1-phosphate isomerase [Methanomicrobiales archaeon]|nr:S-methyl-5-thioribose-1-phosphate isomerase [Methanomicrobiales archaeon]
MKTIWWDPDPPSVRFIDQTLLPGVYAEVGATTVERLVEGIRRLEVRGAPALGIAGGMGVALAAMYSRETDPEQFRANVGQMAVTLRNARPTAVNLSWGVDRVLRVVQECPSVDDARTMAVSEAELIAAEDEACCRKIGEYGAHLLPDTCTVLTHCNAGALACSTWGTALGVVRSAVAAGKKVRVIATETRPLLQGSRLTAWELTRDGIAVTVIADSAAAFLMRRKEIDCVIVGADRITRDAVFNKIGTYMHAVTAHHHGIPLYVAAPFSTIDTASSESDVAIEERGRGELANCGSVRVIPDGAAVSNYAFDATPLPLVSGIITDSGVFFPPYDVQKMIRNKPVFTRDSG